MEKFDPNITSHLSERLEIDLKSKKTNEELKLALADYINYLIINDFDKLLRLLYKVDLDENLLGINLQQQKEDSGMVIANMIMQRELQKIRSRNDFNQK